jgi:hypothetical protein
MATVVFNVPFNMLTRSTFLGRLTENSPTRIVIQDASRTGVYEGAFSYSTAGDVFGRLDSYSEYQGNSLAWSAAGINFNANTAFQLINANALQTLFSNVLGGPDTIRGSSGSDVIFASTSADLIFGLAGNDDIRGDGGIDVALYQGRAREYTLSNTSFGLRVIDSIAARDGDDILTSVERLKFSDANLALDVSGNAGQVYRLYQAAFDRVPDIGGVSHWIKQKDAGISLDDIAGAFISSAEFKAAYGQATDAAFIGLLYQNVLDRGPDAGGFSYWAGQLARGMPRSEMLVGFSESTENQINTAVATSTGILYFDLA